MNRMLEAKEKRYYKIKDLTEKYEAPVLSFMLNIPGEDKNFEEAVSFHKKYVEKIKNLLEENGVPCCPRWRRKAHKKTHDGSRRRILGREAS